jgi:predicted DNA-binding protein (MmcQ/YjbR family)
MDVETLKNYALAKPATSHYFPFDNETMALRVKGKIFALVPINASPNHANFKCDPIWAEVLRQTYKAVTPGYHMNKVIWK